MSPPPPTIPELGFDTLALVPDDYTRAVNARAARYARLVIEAAAAREELFDACADAARAGHTADALESLVKEDRTEEELEAGATFTAAYIRRKLRDRGVERLRTGPKPRTDKG